MGDGRQKMEGPVGGQEGWKVAGGRLELAGGGSARAEVKEKAES